MIDLTIHVRPDNLVPDPPTATCPHCNEPTQISQGHFVGHLRMEQGQCGRVYRQCPGSHTAPFGDKQPCNRNCAQRAPFNQMIEPAINA